MASFINLMQDHELSSKDRGSYTADGWQHYELPLGESSPSALPIPYLQGYSPSLSHVCQLMGHTCGHSPSSPIVQRDDGIQDSSKPNRKISVEVTGTSLYRDEASTSVRQLPEIPYSDTGALKSLSSFSHTSNKSKNRVSACISIIVAFFVPISCNGYSLANS
jgi:hypothetical protein